jgi:hypothetical protein
VDGWRGKKGPWIKGLRRLSSNAQGDGSVVTLMTGARAWDGVQGAGDQCCAVARGRKRGGSGETRGGEGNRLCRPRSRLQALAGSQAGDMKQFMSPVRLAPRPFRTVARSGPTNANPLRGLLRDPSGGLVEAGGSALQAAAGQACPASLEGEGHKAVHGPRPTRAPVRTGRGSDPTATKANPLGVSARPQGDLVEAGGIEPPSADGPQTVLHA